MAEDIMITYKLNSPYLMNINQEQKVKLLLQIQPGEGLRKAVNLDGTVGVDVCLVLDVSGSMYFEGATKLDEAIAAGKQLIPMLRDNDSLSLIAFTGKAYPIFTNMGKNDVSIISSKFEECRKIDASGTNISLAIREARNLMKKNHSGKPKKIIFLTDGEPVGDTEDAGIREGQLVADSGLTIDCLGFGTDFNLAFMEKVATPSKGRTDLILSEQDAKRSFSFLFQRAQDIVANNAKLTLEFSAKNRATEHYRGSPEFLYLGKVSMPGNERKYTLPLGSVERNQRYDYYFLITVPSQEGYEGNVRLLVAKLVYDIPSLNKTGETVKQDVTVNFSKDRRITCQRDGEVERGYELAEIKRLDRECEEARAKKNHKVVAERYKEIIGRYEALGMKDEMEAYQAALDSYIKKGDVPWDILNQATRSSSKAADSGEITKKLDKNVRRNIFRKHRRS